MDGPPGHQRVSWRTLDSSIVNQGPFDKLLLGHIVINAEKAGRPNNEYVFIQGTNQKPNDRQLNRLYELQWQVGVPHIEARVVSIEEAALEDEEDEYRFAKLSPRGAEWLCAFLVKAISNTTD